VRLSAGGLLVLGAVVLTAGCGGTSQTGIAKGGDLGQGKQLFVSKCGGCHKLADAGTQGTTGPDLDGAFAPSRAQHFRLSTIKQVVYDQIYHAAAPMPRKLVTGGDAASVAAYVASVAGTGEGTEGSPPTVTGTTPGGGAGGGGGGAETQGASFYESLGCSGCHSLTGAPGTGPTFKGLYGSKEQLSTGETVTADDAYLLESILDPDKQIVKGYPKGIMSATIRPGSVSEDQATALIAFIKSKK
jgi:mono/diheme cytochrome c family protein